MSRKRDREKRVRRLIDGGWRWQPFRPVLPGSREHCCHEATDYIRAGFRCPDHDGQGCCQEIPF